MESATGLGLAGLGGAEILFGGGLDVVDDDETGEDDAGVVTFGDGATGGGDAGGEDTCGALSALETGCSSSGIHEGAFLSGNDSSSMIAFDIDSLAASFAASLAPVFTASTGCSSRSFSRIVA